MGPPKPLDSDAQSALADVLKRHVAVDKARGRARPLITLALNEKGEDVVTKGVMGRHLELMLDVCTALPIAAPSKQSVFKPLEQALEWNQSGGSAGKLDVEPAAKRKWAEDNAERLVMCWRYAWASYGRSGTSRCYALNRLKSCFENATRASTDASDGAASQIISDSDNDVEDHEDNQEGVEEVVDSPSVAEDDVHMIVEPAAKPPAAAVEAPAAEAHAPKAPLRRVSKKMSDPESIESDSPPQKRRAYVSVEQPPPAKAPAKAAANAPAAAAGAPSAEAPAAKAPADTSKFCLPPPAHVELTPPPAARDITPPPTRRDLKDRIRRLRTPPRPHVDVPLSPVFESTQKEKRLAMKKKQKKKKTDDTMELTAADKQRNFVESAEDRKWGASMLKSVTQTSRPALRPDIPVCHEKCRKKEMIQRGKTLMQITRRLINKEEVLGQVTATFLKDRFYEVSDILLYVAGQGYSKHDFVRIKMLLNNAD